MASASLECGPGSFCFPLVDHFTELVVRELRAIKLVSEDVLDFIVVVGEFASRKGPRVHVGIEGSLYDRGIGRLKHFSPGTDVVLVDLFDDVIQFKLYARCQQSLR